MGEQTMPNAQPPASMDGPGGVEGLAEAILRRVTHIDVEAEVRYWEDARVNGIEDEDGTLIPGRCGVLWKARIDLEMGRVQGWPQGTSADIHYKVCDAGEYWLSDSGGARIAKWKGHYVPNRFLCHGDSGFGDYIIMKVGEDGTIRGYRQPFVDDDEWLVLDPSLTNRPEGGGDGG